MLILLLLLVVLLLMERQASSPLVLIGLTLLRLLLSGPRLDLASVALILVICIVTFLLVRCLEAMLPPRTSSVETVLLIRLRDTT